jgi:polar amino acid transport system substrate-binding protein
MGVPKSRGPDAAAFLAKFVEEMKASRFIADALQRHQIKGHRSPRRRRQG